jgi:hypothetical protein
MRLIFIATAVALVVAIPATGIASPARVEHWSAASSTAMAITGNILLSPTRLLAAGKTLPLAVAADVTDFHTNQGPQSARILKVTRPADPTLLNDNTLCGAPVRWIAVYRSDGGKDLNMSVFKGATRPHGEIGPDVCGTFLYSR